MKYTPGAAKISRVDNWYDLCDKCGVEVGEENLIVFDDPDSVYDGIAVCEECANEQEDA